MEMCSRKYMFGDKSFGSCWFRIDMECPEYSKYIFYCIHDTSLQKGITYLSNV